MIDIHTIVNSHLANTFNSNQSNFIKSFLYSKSLEIPLLPVLMLGLVKWFQETWWSLLLVSSPSLILKSADTLVSQNFQVLGDVLVQVTGVDEMPLSLMDHLVSKLDFMVNWSQVCHCAVLSEMVWDEYFCLDWWESVKAK